MKNLLWISILSTSLFSCSLLQRHIAEEDAGVQDLEAESSEDGPLFDANGQEMSSSSESGRSGQNRDAEVARLNTKIAALETKVDVLTSNLERVQAMKSQPVIEAAPRPQANMAAPVEIAEEDSEPAPLISAAPAKPAPVIIKPSAATGSAQNVGSAAEKEFRAAMQLFQNGRHLEAASRFALVAQKHSNHLLAAHALYWAGESSFRAQQMGLAAENWTELEKRYPRSAYLPEALAGLAKAYDAQGETSQASHYRSLLLKAFPKSPVALKMGHEQAPARAARTMSHAPAAAPEEEAPSYEGESEELDAAGAESQ